MKKYLLLFVMAFGFSVLGSGQILYEDFNYTVPGYVGGNGAVGTSSNNWTTHSVTTGQTTTIDLQTGGSLSYPGLTASAGSRVKLPGTNTPVSRDINRGFTSTATVLYYSALVNVIDATQLSATTPDYFMCFGATSGASVTTLGGRLGARSSNTAANYRLAILNQSTPSISALFTDWTSDLNFGTTYLVVVKYDRSTTPTTASLWVNPVTIGGAEPAGQVTNNIGTNPFTAFASICLRNGSGTPKVEVDEIRVGATWADVTPTGTISAPTTQTSNFTFTNILQTQMNVSWTSGNGGNRVVKMKTGDNIFTPPADGSNPTATTVWANAGEQVVYNGPAATVPIITGLTTATTYYFQAWEYNGSGSSTVYCTSAGANNPLSQTTAAAATAPLVSSPTATAITATSALLGGDITADGGAAITERGTVWSLTTPVTIADNKLAEGLFATGIFTHTRSGLPNKTLIHYAAYATNSVGTTLSAEGTFTTLLGEPSNQADPFAATAPTFSTITNTWLDNDGIQPATGFLIMGNTTGAFVDPVDGSQPTSDPNLGDGSGFVYVNHGAQTFTWTGLLSSTHYYFAIYAYTNSGTNIDYKLVAPAADVTTPVFVQPVAAWTFDATPGVPSTPSSVAANYGDQTGTAMLYADGSNGSATWITALTNNELTTFGGTIINDPREGAAAISGNAYTPVAGTGMSANGKSMVFKFSMSALQNAVITLAIRGTASGFNFHQWAWSTDNITYTNVGPNTADNSTNFVLKTLDLTSVTQINGAPDVYLKITFSGATSTGGNNRLDNVVIHASAATTLPPTVVTNAAVLVDPTSFTLHGTVNANNQTTAVSFDYGTAPGVYGLTIAGNPVTATGNATTPITADLTGLAQYTFYYYRISGTNTNGTSNGGELFFQTGCVTPGVAGTISGPASVVSNGTAYVYSIPAIPNATAYVWSFPAPFNITAGDGTNTVTVTFGAGALSGDVTVFGVNPCDEPSTTATYPITVVTVPVTLDVTGTVSTTVCYNATQTITVAGISTFEVLVGGTVTMIAGTNILYMPGTLIHSGASMHGYIAPGGPYCSPAKVSTEIAGTETPGVSLMDNSFKIYPNPTSGLFTIEHQGDVANGLVRVDVLGTLGSKVLSTQFQGVSKQELSIKGNPPGIYFVRVSSGEKVQTVKIILTN